MTDNIFRTVEVQDEELKEKLKAKTELADKNKEIMDKIKELQKELTLINADMDVLKQEIVTLSEPHVKDIKVGEYEQVAIVELEGDQVVFKVADLLEQFKEKVKEMKEQINKKDDAETNDK